MEGSPVAKSRGKPKNTIGEIIKKDLEVNSFNIDKSLWHWEIHVADLMHLIR